MFAIVGPIPTEKSAKFEINLCELIWSYVFHVFMDIWLDIWVSKVHQFKKKKNAKY